MGKWTFQIPGETNKEAGIAGKKTVETVKAVSTMTYHKYTYYCLHSWNVLVIEAEIYKFFCVSKCFLQVDV